MLMLRIASILFPIFFIVFIAYLYARHRPVDMRIPNQLLIWMCLFQLC